MFGLERPGFPHLNRTPHRLSYRGCFTLLAHFVSKRWYKSLIRNKIFYVLQIHAKAYCPPVWCIIDLRTMQLRDKCPLLWINRAETEVLPLRPVFIANAFRKRLILSVFLRTNDVAPLSDVVFLSIILLMHYKAEKILQIHGYYQTGVSQFCRYIKSFFLKLCVRYFYT